MFVCGVVAAMPPRQKSVSELGHVQPHGNGFRVKLKLEERSLIGPTRLTEADAETDLVNMRTLGSRDAIPEFLQGLRATEQ